MEDEFDEEETDIVTLPDGDLIVSGDASLKELEDMISVDFPDEDYDTIAGLVLHLLDRIPEPDEKPEVIYDRVVVQVLEMEDKWISKLRIHILPAPKKTEEKSKKAGNSDESDG